VELTEYAFEPLRKDEEFILYRGRSRNPKDAGAPSILWLAPVSIRPAPETVKKIEHEYSFKRLATRVFKHKHRSLVVPR